MSRLFTVTTTEKTRMQLMYETVLSEAQEKHGTDRAAKAAYYMGNFSQRVCDSGLELMEDCAFSVMTTLLQSSANQLEKIAVFSSLVEFCYLCAWCEAEAVFQMALDEQQVRS